MWLRRTAGSALSWFLRWHPFHKGVIVLLYHRIGSTDDGLPGLDESLFRAQMEWICENLTPIAPDELRARAEAPPGRRLPLLVTFDDGYRDYRERAYPVLRRMGIPSLVLLTTAFIDQPFCLFWWESLALAFRRTRVRAVELPWRSGEDRTLASREDQRRCLREVKAHLKSVSETEKLELHGELVRRLGFAAADLPGPRPRRMLTWDDVRATRDITTYGGHGHTHALLSRVDADSLEAEIRNCRDRIKAETGEAPRYFAYPNGAPGDFNDAVKESLRRHGFDTAFTTVPGVTKANVDWMAVPRYSGSGEIEQMAGKLVGLTRGWSARRS